MAGPLRGGGVRKKELFWELYLLFCCYLKIKDILLKTTYQNINTDNVGKVVFVVFYQVCCNFWQKHMALLVQKLWGG